MGMFETVMDKLTTMLVNNEKETMESISYVLLFWGCTVLVSLQSVTAPYGRYARPGWGPAVPARFAWFIQELPSIAVPFIIVLFGDCPKTSSLPNCFALGLFLTHYFQRTFIFPLLIRGGKPTPLIPFVMAFLFCSLNGYLQGGYLLKYASIEWSANSAPRIIAGVVMFFSGLAINVHSDHLLRNLRKHGDTGYKIPRGGLFEYVSGANFFGEIMEWSGFAITCWSLPAMAFAVFTSCNLGPRATQHHKWYQEKFEDYPKNRKSLIPFIR